MSKKEDFKKRLRENNGKSIDGTKVKGMNNNDEIIRFDFDKKVIKLKTDKFISEKEKLELKETCNSILNIIDDYEIGKKIMLSNVCDTFYDFLLINKNEDIEKKNFEFKIIS